MICMSGWLEWSEKVLKKMIRLFICQKLNKNHDCPVSTCSEKGVNIECYCLTKGLFYYINKNMVNKIFIKSIPMYKKVNDYKAKTLLILLSTMKYSDN